MPILYQTCVTGKEFVKCWEFLNVITIAEIVLVYSGFIMFYFYNRKIQYSPALTIGDKIQRQYPSKVD